MRHCRTRQSITRSHVASFHGTAPASSFSVIATHRTPRKWHPLGTVGDRRLGDFEAPKHNIGLPSCFLGVERPPDVPITAFPILADAVEVKTGARSTAHWPIPFIRLNEWLRHSFAQLIRLLDIDGIGQNWKDSNISPPICERSIRVRRDSSLNVMYLLDCDNCWIFNLAPNEDAFDGVSASTNACSDTSRHMCHVSATCLKYGVERTLLDAPSGAFHKKMRLPQTLNCHIAPTPVKDHSAEERHTQSAMKAQRSSNRCRTNCHRAPLLALFPEQPHLLRACLVLACRQASDMGKSASYSGRLSPTTSHMDLSVAPNLGQAMWHHKLGATNSERVSDRVPLSRFSQWTPPWSYCRSINAPLPIPRRYRTTTFAALHHGGR